MSTLDLRSMLGQMLIMGFDGKDVNVSSDIVRAIDEDHLGGVILFDYHYQKKCFDKNIESPAQVKQLNQTLQHYAQHFNRQHQRPELPLLITVDYEGGQVNRLKSTYGFPETIAPSEVGVMGALEGQAVARAMALTLKDLGFNFNFVPMLDVNVNPDNPIVGQLNRSFSSDPNKVVECAKWFIDAHAACRLGWSYKHFPGHGSSTSDSHVGFVDVTTTWQPYELEPYRQLLAESHPLATIMTAHIINHQLDPSGLPATLSSAMLTGLLRHELNYAGIIMSDDMQMKAIADHFGLKDALTLAVNAGVDMFIFGNQLADTPQTTRSIIDLLEAQVKAGAIKLKTVEDSYARIVALKKALDQSF